MRKEYAIRSAAGATMVEVLVTIVIIAAGLLGLVGLQARLQTLEVDAYQRSQAMILLEDMANRIAVNRNHAPAYVTGAGTPLGSGMSCPVTTAGSTQQQRDSSEWCSALQGAGEKSGASKIGVMTGGRGCVEDLGNNQYLITVAWQGMGPVSAPPASVACGKNNYDDGKTCTGDLCRRALTTVIKAP